jgi:hypothetical protein
MVPREIILRMKLQLKTKYKSTRGFCGGRDGDCILTMTRFNVVMDHVFIFFGILFLKIQTFE